MIPMQHLLGIGYATLILAAHGQAEPWQRHQIYDASRLCNGLDAADVNADGFHDYVTNFEDTGRIVVMRHPGAKDAREPWPWTEIGRFERVESSCFGDFDGDGWPDVAVAHGKEEEGEQAGITILWHPGNAADAADGANWVNSAFIPDSMDRGNYLFVRALDVNGDGNLDMVAGGRTEGHAGYRVKTEGRRSVGMVWLEAPSDEGRLRGMDAWKVHEIDGAIISGHGFELGDIDGDGDTDIALANADWGTPDGAKFMLWYENPGPGNEFQRFPWPKHLVYQSEDFYTKPGIAVTDLDGDGANDLLSQTETHVVWLRNNGTGTAFETIEIPKRAPLQWRGRPIATEDLDADGRKEIVLGLIHKDGYLPVDVASLAYLSKGDGDAWKPIVIKMGDGYDSETMWEGEKWDNLRFADVDRDGDMDVVANCEEYGPLGVEWFENQLN